MPLPPCSRVMTRTQDAVIVWSRHKLRFQPRRISYPGFLQSSAVRFVELCSDPNPEQSRSLQKKGALLRRWAYAMRTATKAIALSAQ